MIIKERDIKAYLTAVVEELGGELRKVKWEGRSHAPDQLILLSKFHALAELKRPGKDATAGQAREHIRLRKAGFIVLVLNTYEKIDKFKKDYQQGKYAG